MNILVTAGNTLVPIDRVRSITNIFTGRTGARLALHGHERGHKMTLLTSHPEVVEELAKKTGIPTARWAMFRYQTYEDLHLKMKEGISGSELDAVIHCAAVSDFRSAGIFAPAPGTQFDAASGQWHTDSPGNPKLVDRAAGKVKSDAPELWLRLVPTPKLIDLIRRDWNFKGVLVKFKLEVGIQDQHLLDIAEMSRQHSEADLMVANTLEGAASWAYLGPLKGQYQKIPRGELPERLIEGIEQLHKNKSHG